MRIPGRHIKKYFYRNTERNPDDYYPITYILQVVKFAPFYPYDPGKIWKMS